MNTKYTIKDFLKDSEFIQWVNNPDSDSSTFWNLLAEGDSANKEEMMKAIEIIQALKIKQAYPDENLKQEVLNDIVSRISTSLMHNEKSDKKNTHKLFKVLLKSAAAFLILFLTAFSLYYLLQTNEIKKVDSQILEQKIVKKAPMGAKFQTILPDGSTVIINSGSSIEYYFDGMSNTRNVNLQGEAFFDIVENPNRPFVVKAKELSIKVVGTSFNVCAYKDKNISEIALLTGKVIVSESSNLSTLELVPGEKAILNNEVKGFTKAKFDYLKDVGWKDGIMVFNRANFHVIKEKLERWFGITIFITDKRGFNDWELDGQYENMSLEMILKHLSYTKEFTFEIDGKKVYLSKNN